MPTPSEVPDVHDELWEVVGVMKPTHTAADRGLYIPLLTFYSIAEHEVGLAAHAQARQGQTETSNAAGHEHEENYELVFGDELDPSLPHTRNFISVKTPIAEWELSAIMVKSRGGVSGQELQYHIQNGGIAGDVQAVIPAVVMQSFFDTFFKGSTTILLIISLLVSVVAAVGILVSIYNSVAARMREIAILRALGATRARVLTLICLEAGLIGLTGGILGLLIGHGLGGVASSSLQARVGQGFNWLAIGVGELLYLCVVVAIAVLAGFVPAIKAYRTPVATNLTAA
jgi:putative ABC transport system permease protein